MLDYLITDEGGPGFLPPLERVPDEGGRTLNDREEIFAAANTVKVLQELGDDIHITEEDEVRAQEIFESARAPTAYERKLPGVMLKLEALLNEYDHRIIDDAQQVRTYVTNRLLEESNDPDPKNRLRALEMLGKISDVGLFAERKEVTIRHQSTEDLEDILRKKLSTLLDGEAEDITDAEIVESPRKEAIEYAKSITADDLLDQM